MNRQERMKELVELLNKASKAYYQDAEEIMSNYEYDKLYDELQELERELGITLPIVRRCELDMKWSVNSQKNGMKAQCFSFGQDERGRGIKEFLWEIRRH